MQRYICTIDWIIFSVFPMSLLALYDLTHFIIQLQEFKPAWCSVEGFVSFVIFQEAALNQCFRILKNLEISKIRIKHYLCQTYAITRPRANEYRCKDFLSITQPHGRISDFIANKQLGNQYQTKFLNLLTTVIQYLHLTISSVGELYRLLWMELYFLAGCILSCGHRE